MVSWLQGCSAIFKRKTIHMIDLSIHTIISAWMKDQMRKETAGEEGLGNGEWWMGNGGREKQPQNPFQMGSAYYLENRAHVKISP